MGFFKNAAKTYVETLKDPTNARAAIKAAATTAAPYLIPGVKHAENTAIQVKEYRNAKEFQKDATKMLATGWTIAGQTVMGGRAFKNARITVTYLPAAPRAQPVE